MLIKKVVIQMKTCREYRESMGYGSHHRPVSPDKNQSAVMILVCAILVIPCVAFCVMALLVISVIVPCVATFITDRVIDLVYFLIQNGDRTSVCAGGSIAILAILVPRYVRRICQTIKARRDQKQDDQRKFHGHTYAYYRGAPAEDQW